eukprot:6458790-Amphidinium_carterae.1
MNELVCPLCLEPGGLHHAIWKCEARTLSLVGMEPPLAATRPVHFTTAGLVLEGDNIPIAEVHATQRYMTKVLIHRRILQQPLDEADKARRKRARADAGLSDPGIEGQHGDPQDPAEPIDVEDPPSPQPPGPPQAPDTIQDDVWFDGTAAIAGTAKRRKWNLADIPDHIQLQDTQFKRIYRCHHCNCYTAAAARSSFFSTHWRCSGVAANVKRARHFVRKSTLAVNAHRVPDSDELFNVAWYQMHGILPQCIEQQPHSNLLQCTLCQRADRTCNRLRFMTKHLACLRNSLQHQSDLEPPEALPARSQKRCKVSTQTSVPPSTTTFDTTSTDRC